MKTLDTLRLQLFDESEINKCLNVEHRFVCSICVEICYSIDKLKIHYVNVHGFIEKRNEMEISPPQLPPNKSKICTVCNLPFKNSKTLSKHVKHVHNKIKAFKCSVCSKMFSRKSAMEIHMKQHLSDVDSTKIPCPYPDCKFKASDPSVVSKHKKIHQTTNEGKYRCLDESCNYFAIQSTGLKNHMNSKHPELYANMKCTYSSCEFVSVSAERLRRHLNDHELSLLDKSDEISLTPTKDMRSNNLNSSMEISSDSFIPIESTDSIVNTSLDTGGVTIVHNTSSNVHSEDAVF